MCGWLCWSVHWHPKLLLWKLLWELEGIRMRRHVRNLALHGKVWNLLLRRHHAHVDVLLVLSCDLLLLLLQQFDLLGERKLFHWKLLVSQEH